MKVFTWVIVALVLLVVIGFVISEVTKPKSPLAERTPEKKLVRRQDNREAV